MNRDATYYTPFLTNNNEEWLLEIIPALNTPIGATRTALSPYGLTRSLNIKTAYNVVPHKLPVRSSLNVEFDANVLTDAEREILINEIYTLHEYTPPSGAPVLAFDYLNRYILRKTTTPTVTRADGYITQVIPQHATRYVKEYVEREYVYEENPYDGSKELKEYEIEYGFEVQGAMPDMIFGIEITNGNDIQVQWFKKSSTSTVQSSSVFDTWTYGNVWRVKDADGVVRFEGMQKRTPGSVVEHTKPIAKMKIEVVSIERAVFESMKAERIISRLKSAVWKKAKRIEYGKEVRYSIVEQDTLELITFPQLLSAIQAEATDIYRSIKRNNAVSVVIDMSELGVDWYMQGASTPIPLSMLGVQMQLLSQGRAVSGVLVPSKDATINMYDFVTDLMETLFVKAQIVLTDSTMTIKTKRLLNSFDAVQDITEDVWISKSQRTISIGKDSIRGAVATAKMPHTNDKKQYTKAQNTSERESDMSFNLIAHNILSFNEHEHTGLFVEMLADSSAMKALSTKATVWLDNERKVEVEEVTQSDRLSAVYFAQEEASVGYAIAQGATECFGWNDVGTIEGEVITSATLNSTTVGNIYTLYDTYITHSPRKATLTSCDEDCLQGTAKVTFLLHHAD